MTTRPVKKEFSLTVHNMTEFNAFQRLVLMCAGEKIEWETPHGRAAAVFCNDATQGFVYKAASFTIPAEQFMRQMIESELELTVTGQFTPGQCTYA